MELPLGDVVRSVQSVYWLCGLAALSASLLLLVLQILAKSSNNGQRSAIAVKNSKKSKGSATVLLVGPMGAGKTSFYGKVRQSLRSKLCVPCLTLLALARLWGSTSYTYVHDCQLGHTL